MRQKIMGQFKNIKKTKKNPWDKSKRINKQKNEAFEKKTDKIRKQRHLIKNNEPTSKFVNTM